MLKYNVFFVGLFGLGLVCSAPAEEARVNRTLIPLSGGKTRASTGIFFGPESVTWAEAKQSCQQAGFSLLAIDSQAKHNKFYLDLQTNLPHQFDGWTGEAWTAGSDRLSTTGGVGAKRFYWSAYGSQQQAMKYFNFATGPNVDPDSGCVAVSNQETLAAFAKWFVEPCATELVYFCENI